MKARIQMIVEKLQRMETAGPNMAVELANQVRRQVEITRATEKLTDQEDKFLFQADGEAIDVLLKPTP